MTPLAAVDAWRFQPHPEVWFLVAAVIGLGLYVTRVIGPKVAEPGEPVVTGRQRFFFWAGIVVLWIASDWPMHDISEEYLYGVHMVQHLLLTLVLPPLFLLATPTWLARLLVGGGGIFARWVRRLSRPIVALLVYNALVALTHWPAVVNVTVEVGELHYLAHTALVASAFMLWMPVCGPIPEWRISRPAQMLYLFVNSIVPTVPSAWLILAENPVYEVYDHTQRLWGIGVIDDQQVAGLIMKLVGGLYLWTIITVIFFRWAFQQLEADREGRGSDREVLTFEQVEEEFGRLGPAPVETVPLTPPDPSPD